MEVGVEVEGLKEFNRALKRFGDDLPKHMTLIHKELATPVAKKAQALAPSKSGALRNSIRALSSAKSAAVAAGKKRVPYAAVIHWGWPKHGIRPQQFMTRAIQGMEGDLVKQYQDELQKLIEKAITKEG